VSPENYPAELNPWISEVFALYEASLAASRAIDREDIVRLTIQIIQKTPSLLRELVTQYEYWIIDQYEDASPVVHELVRLITSEAVHVTLCGDPNQAVGHELGIDGSVLAQAGKTIPNAKIVVLSAPFRYGQTIADVLQALRKDPQKPKKPEVAPSTGESMVYFMAFDEQEEAAYVISEIQMMKREERLSFNDFCIFFRAQSQAYFLEEQCRQSGIRFRTTGKQSVYANSEIRDIILYLRLVFNPADRQALAQLLSLQPFAVEQSEIDSLIQYSNAHSLSLAGLKTAKLPVDDGTLKKVIGLVDLIAHWEAIVDENPDMNAGELLNQIVVDSGYQFVLETENTLDSYEQLQTIAEFIMAVSESQWTVEQLLNHLTIAALEEEPFNSGEAVTIMPLRSAKSTEFQVAFVCGLEEGLLPHYNSQFDPAAVDEERRLLYTGISRAKRHAVLTSAFRRSMFGAEWYDDVSRFIKEIPADRLACFVSERLNESHEILVSRLREDGYRLQAWEPHVLTTHVVTPPEFKPGDVVEHHSWGRGVVQNIEGAEDKMILQILFKDQERKLMARYADVTKL
ncbi:hypothetical protein EBR96_07070, partial [bacterium]|nr:hypothetical protein [bacterium]